MPPTLSWRQIYRDACEAIDGPAETVDRLTASAIELAREYDTVRGEKRKQVRQDMVATKLAIEFAQKKLQDHACLMKSHFITVLALNVRELLKDGANPALLVASLANVAADTAQLNKKHGAALLDWAAAFLTQRAQALRKRPRKRSGL